MGSVARSGEPDRSVRLTTATLHGSTQIVLVQGAFLLQPQRVTSHDYN